MSLSLLLSTLLLGYPLIFMPSYISEGNSFPKPLSAKEEAEYIKKLEDGDPSARNVLVEHNLRLVAHIAKKYSNTGIDPDDIISIGTIGLMKSIETFKAGKSVRLGTYAARCVENEILMWLRKSKKERAEISINEPIGSDREGNEISFNDILGTDGSEISEGIEKSVQKKELYDAVQNKLRERERIVLIKRYGLFNQESMTQQEVADELNISRSYVSRIEKKAIGKLRECFSLYE